MKNLILKKITYLDNDFYKILDVKDDFDKNDEYDDFNNVLNSKKNLFYYEIDNQLDFNKYIGRIVGNHDGEIFLLPEDLESEINGYLQMDDNYQQIDNKEIKEIIDILNILFKSKQLCHYLIKSMKIKK